MPEKVLQKVEIEKEKLKFVKMWNSDSCKYPDSRDFSVYEDCLWEESAKIQKLFFLFFR